MPQQEMTKKVMRRLNIQSFHMTSTEFGDTFAIEKVSNTPEQTYKLILPREYSSYMTSVDVISSLTMRIIPPENHHVHNESIMDIFPISTKVLGKIGEGTSRTITGVYGMITGVDENGVPVCAFGNSDGMLDEQMVLGMAGTPDKNDYIICFDAILKAGEGFQRTGPNAVHHVVDLFCQNIRELLKKFHANDCTESHTYEDIIRPGKKKVALVKLVSGQGAMYDTRFLPSEPSGFENGHSVIDITGVPVLLSPNEYRDGAIRALY